MQQLDLSSIHDTIYQGKLKYHRVSVTYDLSRNKIYTILKRLGISLKNSKDYFKDSKKAVEDISNKLEVYIVFTDEGMAEYVNSLGKVKELKKKLAAPDIEQIFLLELERMYQESNWEDLDETITQ